eukprot:gene7384-8203_t
MRALLITLFLLIGFRNVICHWWLLSSQVFSVGSTIGCNNIAGLVKSQRAICTRYPKLMLKVGVGASRALAECQRQFSFDRWNCSATDGSSPILGKLMTRANRESAFFHAISSAGVVHEVTRSCSRGELGEECSCDKRSSGTYAQGFIWDRCNDNIKFGTQFSRAFLDAREVVNDARALLNKHNNEAGRQAVLRNMEMPCKCHGMSGSCTTKYCHRSLPPFEKVGDYLHKKYRAAVLVTLDQSSNKLVNYDKVIHKYGKPDLVYLEQSPNYCYRDEKHGTIGTSGRECNKSALSENSCGIICCGRGYTTKKVKIRENCHCKFIWCCKVECQKCTRIVDKHYCKGPANAQRPNGGQKHTNSLVKLTRKNKKRNRKNKKRNRKNKKKRRRPWSTTHPHLKRLPNNR